MHWALVRVILRILSLEAFQNKENTRGKHQTVCVSVLTKPFFFILHSSNPAGSTRDAEHEDVLLGHVSDF